MVNMFRIRVVIRKNKWTSNICDGHSSWTPHWVHSRKDEKWEWLFLFLGHFKGTSELLLPLMMQSQEVNHMQWLWLWMYSFVHNHVMSIRVIFSFSTASFCHCLSFRPLHLTLYEIFRVSYIFSDKYCMSKVINELIDGLTDFLQTNCAPDCW